MNQPPVINPLTEEHCKNCNVVLSSIPITRDLIQRCKECGLDMTSAEQYLASQEHTARTIKAQFFPHET